MAASIIVDFMRVMTSGTAWNIFNMVQLIELIALIELDNPERLEQFFTGFDFTLLHTPKEINLLEKTLVDPNKDRAYSVRFDSFGFSSSYVIVQ